MLNGRWELAEAGKDTLCAVQVPGSVISGLYGAGKIEDPFYRTDEDATRELFCKNPLADYGISINYYIKPDCSEYNFPELLQTFLYYSVTHSFLQSYIWDCCIFAICPITRTLFLLSLQPFL